MSSVSTAGSQGTTGPTSAAQASGDTAADRKTAETLAAAQASLFASASTTASATASPSSNAIDLIQQSQQGFAKLDSEAKAKAEAARTHGKDGAAETRKEAAKVPAKDVARGSTEVTDKATPVTTAVTVKPAANDDQIKAGVARVTALYLDNSDETSPSKQAA